MYISIAFLMWCFFLFEVLATVYGDTDREDSHHHHHHHHHYKHQGLDLLICSISGVTTALTNVSSVFQFFFLVACSDMISKGFGLVAFFASVKASSVCIHLSCPVCIQSVVHGYGVVCFVVVKGVAC
jgi:hypothetical protein